MDAGTTCDAVRPLDKQQACILQTGAVSSNQTSDSEKALLKAIDKGEDKIFELKDGIHCVGNKKKMSKDKKKKQNKKKTKNK